MGICIEAYRASIGTFRLNCIKKKRLLFPKCMFNQDANHYFSYHLHEWSALIFGRGSRERLLVKGMISYYLGFTLIIHILIAMCGDVHPNPGPNLNVNDIKVCHCNIRSLKAKDKFFYLKTELGGVFDIITCSETWLSERDASKNFYIPNYQHPFRKDRSFGRQPWGGVMAWVSDSIACKRREDLEQNNLEAMWLELCYNNQKLFLCVVYRAESNTDETFWELFQDNINNVRALLNPRIFVCGDLNADSKTRHGKLFQEFIDSNDFEFHIREPTRITEKTSSVLDQCFSNFTIYQKDVEILPPLPHCDHCIISAKFSFKIKKPRPYKRLMWNFSKANFDIYRQQLKEVKWDECFDCDDIDKICDNITSEILEVAKLTIPNKLVTVRPADKTWYTNELRQMKQKMLRLFRQANRSKNKDDWDKFSKHRKNYYEKISEAKEAETQKRHTVLAAGNKTNPKRWWSILKGFYKESENLCTIPPIEDGGNIIIDDAEKAKMFNQFFISASSLDETGALVPDHVLINEEKALTEIDITLQDVIDQIKCLDSSKSYGPDGVSPVFLKEGIDILSPVLLKLFRHSLQKGIVPLSFKKANVIPIHKKDLKTIVANYRPISLLSILSKVFEKIVFKYVYNFFKENFILSVFQSGFQSGKSTITQLLEVYHKFCEAVDKNKEIRVVFLDIHKAFDKVWHRGLLYKLKQCGIGGRLLDWFTNYLQNRQQRVVINGQSSEWATITAGIPQGSVLGPLLFLLFIDDITHVVEHCNIRLFADDTCLFIEVDNRLDVTNKINSDLENINTWAKNWLVTFSARKTKSLIISNKKDLHLHPKISLDGNDIDEVSSYVYLGLRFSNNLKWSHHIDDISVKAKKRLNLMVPLKYKLDRKSLEVMYNSFVLPSMEYGNVIWGGTFDTEILKLERIHVDGMRLVTGATARSNIANLYYDTCWYSIPERCRMASLIMMYKVKYNLCPEYLHELLPPENFEIIRYNLRNNQNLVVPATRSEMFKRSFFPHAVRLWNDLSIEHRHAPSLEDFKASIKPKRTCNILYYYGKRWPSVHHSRIRIGCSKLKFDLCYNLHVVDDPICACGHVEDANHFFLTCPNYVNIRLDLFNVVSIFTEVKLTTLLEGDPILTEEQNKIIFDAVQTYIIASERFI